MPLYLSPLSPRWCHRIASPSAASRRPSAIAIHLPIIDILAAPTPRCINGHIAGNSVPLLHSSTTGQYQCSDYASSTLCYAPYAWANKSQQAIAGLALRSSCLVLNSAMTAVPAHADILRTEKTLVLVMSRYFH